MNPEKRSDKLTKDVHKYSRSVGVNIVPYIGRDSSVQVSITVTVADSILM